MAKMSLEWPEQLHGIFIKERACFGTANLCLLHSAFDRKYGLDLIEFAAVDGGLAALVIKRVEEQKIHLSACGCSNGSDHGNDQPNMP
jgi:hypothetical protein